MNTFFEKVKHISITTMTSTNAPNAMWLRKYTSDILVLYITLRCQAYATQTQKHKDEWRILLRCRIGETGLNHYPNFTYYSLSLEYNHSISGFPKSLHGNSFEKSHMFVFYRPCTKIGMIQKSLAWSLHKNSM